VPVAFKGCAVPRAKEGLIGVTAIETSTGCATESRAEPETEFKLATMVEFPMPAPRAKPVLLTLATPGADEPQLTELVTSCVLPLV
jgi:hypothetical protein